MPITSAFTQGQQLTAQNTNSFPFGLVATSSGGTSSIGYRIGLGAQTVNAGAGYVDVTNSSMTFTGVSGRLYWYYATGEATNSSASGLATIAITDGSNNALQRSHINMTNSAGSAFFAIGYAFTATGTTTLKMRLLSTTGNTTIYNATSQGAIFLIDMGPTS